MPLNGPGGAPPGKNKRKMRERINEYDYLKCVFITLMVVFHLAHFADRHLYAKDIVYTFHMPAFLILSGYLANVAKDCRAMGRQLLWLFVPYAAMEAAYAVATGFMDVRESIGQLSALSVAEAVALHPIGPYWYLHTLLLCLAAYWLAARLLRRAGTATLALALALALWLLAEFVVGRRSHANTYGAFAVLAPGSKWPMIGIITVAAASIILAFYSVVGGWTADYLLQALAFKLPDSEGTMAFFQEVTASPFRPQIFTVLFLLLTAGVLMTGIKNGIEKYSKILMPLLFVVVIIIAIRSMTLSGAEAGLKFLFKPDFSKGTGTTVLEALGQAFFSSSIGIGTILTYASYVNKQENIIGTSFMTSLANVVFALIAGVAIMPAVFAFGPYCSFS